MFLKQILSLLILIISLATTASENFRFKKISVSDGLSNNWVRCSFQDENGYMWFGTDDGLNRFDGSNIKTYRPLNNYQLEMGNAVIYSILGLDDGNLWLCTEIGLFLFDQNKKTISADTILPPHPVLSATYDKEGNKWLGTNRGLFKINSESQRQNFNALNTKNLTDNYINTLQTDSKGFIWIGTKHGLTFFNPNNESFNNFFGSDFKHGFSGKDITSICEDNQGRIWIGTALDGLYLLTKENNQFTSKRIIEGQIFSLLFDGNSKLWIGFASGGGIGLMDMESLNQNRIDIIYLKNDPLDKNSLGDNSIFNFYQDKNGDIWISTFGGGVNYYSNRTKPFKVVRERFGTDQSIKNNLVNCFWEDENFIWIGTEGGLDCFDKSKGKYNHFQYEENNPSSLLSNSIQSILKDSRGNLWVGTWAGGLHLYNPVSKKFKRFAPDNKPGSIGSSNISSICEDHKGNLWIGTTGGGLNLYNYNTGKFTIYKHESENNKGFSGRSMSHVFSTSTGELYISMYSHLVRYDSINDLFEPIYPREFGTNDSSFRGNILYMYEDSKKNLWLASSTGLKLFDPIEKTYKTFTKETGLPGNTIQGILEDDKGNLWLSTNNGISKFFNAINLPEKPIFYNFSIYDGLPSNDFKKKAAFKNERGEFYFGSSQGYVSFRPNNIALNLLIPNIVFTQFLLLETSPNSTSKFKEIEKDLNVNNNIQLHYPNTDFSISFASLNYLNPVKNQFRYKLEGYDTEWVDAGNSTSATYTNLKEGKYKFLVMGSNNDGIWNPTPRELIIEIFPPWWRTTVFKIFIILFLLLSLASLIIARFIILNRENKMLEAVIEKRTNELTKLNSLLETKQSIILDQNAELSKHQNNLEQLVEERTKQLAEARAKAEESDRLKSAFLANMSHEIRTPMNAIVGFSNLLVSGDIALEKREKYSEMIKSNSKQLFVLINDIIDISIIESNQLILSKGRFNATTILRELFSHFEIENTKNLDFNYLNQNDNNDLILYNDAIRFRQVMVNLLSNAFKYTEKGKVEYGYELLENEVRFFVADSGSGIKTDDKDKVFEHFYKSIKDKIKLYRGTGIGLAICKKLVVQMGGRIWVDSQLNIGSTFSFSIPISEKK
jgi:signal transduction histidine kinase/ligand-binding sensor domain-containing protein